MNYAWRLIVKYLLTKEIDEGCSKNKKDLCMIIDDLEKAHDRSERYGVI